MGNSIHEMALTNPERAFLNPDRALPYTDRAHSFYPLPLIKGGGGTQVRKFGVRGGFPEKVLERGGYPVRGGYS